MQTLNDVSCRKRYPVFKVAGIVFFRRGVVENYRATTEQSAALRCDTLLSLSLADRYLNSTDHDQFDPDTHDYFDTKDSSPNV